MAASLSLCLTLSLYLSVAGHSSLYSKEVLQMLALVVGVVMKYAVSNKIKVGSGELGQAIRFLSRGMVG